MAEETDAAQKPKAELIKRTQNSPVEGGEHENADGAKTAPEHWERRRVVVVKKKPSAVPAGSAKRVMSKVVVARGNLQEGDAEVSSAKGKTEPELKTSKETPVPSRTEPPKEESNPSAFLIAQRPVAAAGRVGGKYVGPRPSHEESVRGNFGQNRRPHGASGRVGGRPAGSRGENRSGTPAQQRPFSGRGPAPQGGSNTGSFPGGNRPFAARGPGRTPGAARPGPFAGSTPPPPIDGKGPVKKSFKAKKAVYTRKEKEHEMEEKLLQTKKKVTQIANPVPKSIEIMEMISVSELARKMNLKASELIQKLMNMGQMVTINQQIDADTATILAAEFGADVKIVSLYDETVIEAASDEDAELTQRPPVVTVMGHVDHGKTKLLDAIRSADVVSGEFGGITQHIGAYTVETPQGKITFLDTPGHEAFTRMRARGAQVTDIVIIVVAADDGVMPQTVEAINHAKEAEVPIIVAVNKIDKPEANVDKVKTQLSEYQLIPEDWGGQTMFVEVSALKKEGIDKLIESILLEAEILDLKANYNRSAEGKILESRIDHGRGIVATVMVERGTLKIGDSFVAGVWPGRVRALFTDKGERVTEATQIGRAHV
jgi:translation initiation factor IF-2